MEKILSEILSQLKYLTEDVQGIKEDFKTLKEGQDQLIKEMARRFKQQKKEIKEELTKEMDLRFERQSKEIAQEFRNVIEFFEKKQRKQEKINKKFQNEIENIKITQDGYNSRIYKIERVQSDFESRIYNLENREKIAN